MTEQSNKIHKKQKRLLVAIGVAGIFIATGISFLAVKKPPPPRSTISKPADLPLDKINPQEIWMSRVDAESKVINQEIKVLKEMIVQQTEKQKTAEKEKYDLKTEISRLKQELKCFIEKPQQPIPHTEIREENPFFTLHEEMPPIRRPKLCEVEVIPFETKKVGNVNRTIPANVTAKAILVSGVDATCGAFATANPIPVKLRIIEDAYGYNGQKIRLKGAIISGCAYGNISDERICIRLERLTQFNGLDEFIETEVAGYVTGEDGKYGLRGRMADKSLQVIKNAALSGVLAETSQILQSALSRYTIDNVLTNQSGASNGGPIGQGATAKSSNAFDMLSEYYIRRAEQISPVIQVNAGRIVDITFVHNADVGDIHTRDKIAIVREHSRIMERQDEKIFNSFNDSPFAPIGNGR